jgi:hypothetical protein
MEDDVPDVLADLRAAGLARRDDLTALALEVLLQQLDLRRLAGAVEALEGHEHRAGA